MRKSHVICHAKWVCQWLEEFKGSQPMHNLLVAETQPSVGAILNTNKYSTVCRPLRVTAYVFKAVRFFKDAAQEKQVILSLAEVTEAEKWWICVHKEHLLMTIASNSCKNSLISSLTTVASGDVEGFFQKLAFPMLSSKLCCCPWIIPAPLSLSRMLTSVSPIMELKKNLTEIMIRFWIVKGRSMVKALIHYSVLCKRFEEAPFWGPPPPPLHDFRVRQSPPFTFTGVDYVGPLHVRSFGLNGSQEV